MVNGNGSFINIKMPKININLGLDLKKSSFTGLGKGDFGLKIKPINFGPKFTLTSKQRLISPLKQSASVLQTKKRSAERELAAAKVKIDQGAEIRVKGIMDGGIVNLSGQNDTAFLQASGLAKPTASKVRDALRDEQKGLLQRVAGKSSLSNRQFQVSFVRDGTIQVKTFRDRDEARGFREKLEATGALEEVSRVREVRI